MNAVLVICDLAECIIANALTDTGLVPRCRLLVSHGGKTELLNVSVQVASRPEG